MVTSKSEEIKDNSASQEPKPYKLPKTEENKNNKV